MVSKNKKDLENKAFLARSVETGKFFRKEGFSDLSDIVNYAIKKSTS